jgi:hypothetical protein
VKSRSATRECESTKRLCATRAPANRLQMHVNNSLQTPVREYATAKVILCETNAWCLLLVNIRLQVPL